MGYAEVAVEMNIIFKYIDNDLVEKVPIEFREHLKNIASPTYVSHIDPRFPLDDQPLLYDTEILLAILFREYWANDEDKAEFDSMLYENDLISREKYNPDNIFKKVEEIKESININTNLPDTPKENTFFEKLKNFCRKIWNELFHLDDKNEK